jgi:polyferredoxin
MDREQLGKAIANALLIGLFLGWIIGAFTWVRNAPDIIKILWPGGFFIIFLLSGPIGVIRYWIAGRPNPIQTEREERAFAKFKSEDDPFGG